MKQYYRIIYKYITFLTIPLFLTSCGGGGGGSSLSSGILTGKFIDSEVEGLNYRTTSRSGKTNSNGEFNYLLGETVTFSIGNLDIGSSEGNSTITPIDIVTGGSLTDDRVLNISRLLQTFDNDSDPDNGINLSNAAQNLNYTGNVDFSNEGNITAIKNSVDNGLTLVSKESARNHLKQSLTDPYIDNLWHIKSLGTIVNNTNNVATIEGNDLNLSTLHKTYDGKDIIIQIVDDGVESNHEDLVNNMDLNKSYNADTSGTDPTPSKTSDNHGTQCAGIAAAMGYNGKGVRGVAPLANIAGFKFITSGGNLMINQSTLEKAWLSGTDANAIHISSNSWGSNVDTTTYYDEIMALGTTLLRDGKGRVYVGSAGNGREDNESSNTSYMTSSQYMISVASLQYDDTYSSYSSPGSNILVSAYGGEFVNTSPTIGTTTLSGQGGSTTWSDDTSKNYTYAMNGTSAAAPMVSGAVALVLDACSNLTYRDVKYLIAKHAVQVDSNNSTWVQNGAGFWHSIDYGYGKINTSGMIDDCNSSYVNLGAVKENNTTNNIVDTIIPNDDQNGLSTIVNITSNIDKIEWIGVWLDMSNNTPKDLEFWLQSPAGTTTKLLHSNNELISSDFNSEFRLSSVAFYDEDPDGDWNVTIKDIGGVSANTNTLNSVKLQIVGN